MASVGWRRATKKTVLTSGKESPFLDSPDSHTRVESTCSSPLHDTSSPVLL